MKTHRLIGGLAACALAVVASSTPAGSHPAIDPALHAGIAQAIEYAPPSEAAVIVRQPDGSSFHAQIAPAELGGDLEVDGYTVVKGADGWWRYARTRADSKLIASAAVAGRNPPPVKVVRGVGRIGFGRSAAPTPKQIFAAQLEQASRLAAQRQAATAGPVEFRFPVLLLATWWDTDAGQTAPQFQPGSDTIAHFQKILDGFGGNPSGSLTEFYFENSYGQFLVKVDVFGPYTSQRSRQDRCYYGDINASTNPTDDLDPLDNVLPGGGGAAGMAAEAVPQADPDIDYSVYDNNGDGYVDFMGIVHSGADMATTGNPCNTWSHALAISSLGNIPFALAGLPPAARAGLPTSDGVLVDRIFTMPEFAEKGATLAIGVATHEMAHALGEPDYYAVNGSSSGDGDWDIMSGGSYMGNPSGTNPAWFNPATRVFQGWTTPTIIHEDHLAFHLQPREAPLAGYTSDQPNPRLVLVPTAWIKQGEADASGHTWSAHDVYGLVKDGDRGYVIEGYYLEYISRAAGPFAPLHDGMTRAPYNDRGVHGSGLMAWHFDYWRRSNVYFGANNAQDDANRMQMDVEEFDFYDNSQDISRNLHRGEATDPFLPTATGMTSGAHQAPPGTPTDPGTPQASIALSGTTTPVQAADAPFTVESNPANHTMTVTIVGGGPPPGDCKLQLFRHEGSELKAETKVIDSGSVGDAEVAVVTDPKPGDWVARVSDFAACTGWTGSVVFKAPGGFSTQGSADTWSNATQAPTGWAFTNIRGGVSAGLDFGAESVGPNVITVDILQLADKTDVSPGYAMPAPNAAGGRGAVTAGKANAFVVPVFSNGGVAPGAVRVVVRNGRGATSPIVAAGRVTLGAYERTNFNFNFTPASEGPYELSVRVDPANVIAEGSERNNLQVTSGWAGPANPQVLVVDDEGYTDGEKAYTGALAALGVPYAVVAEHVDAATMARYAAVVWVGAIDRGPGQLNPADVAAITEYLSGGGKLWLASNRAAGALKAQAANAFLAGWFGADSLETTTLEQAYTVKGTGGILGDSTFELQPYPVRPFSDVIGVAKSGVFGTASQTLKIDQAHKPGRDGVGFGTSVVGDDAHGAFRTVLTPFSLGQASTADTAIALTRGVLQFFGVATGQYTVTSDKPLVYHVALRQRDSGKPAPVTAIVLGGTLDPSPVYAFYHRRNDTSYRIAHLLPGAEHGAYAGAMAGNAVTPSGLTYFLRAGGTYDPPLAADHSLNHVIAVSIPEVPKP